MTSTRRRTVHRISTLTFVAVLRELQTGDRTAAALVEASGLHQDTVYRLMRAMRHGTPSQRAAHVSDWLPDSIGRRRIPLFRLGPGQDAARSAAKTL